MFSWRRAARCDAALTWLGRISYYAVMALFSRASVLMKKNPLHTGKCEQRAGCTCRKGWWAGFPLIYWLGPWVSVIAGRDGFKGFCLGFRQWRRVGRVRGECEVE